MAGGAGTRASTVTTSTARNCYYYVRLYEGEVWVADFFVEVGMEFAGDDWSGPGFINELRARIASVAATGKTNTEYTGYVRR